ncbi:ABC transporter permease [Paludicola sp. MB14-C6]|uniref:ABC transporter permease n=1 Tax=Paludihabitans sp. MB14-C6 TaxID=3070656 RepID=UPI0027DB47A4|nr:ABC transporter permease [Paludicola sp. MB14-C6]WMJ22722.1 ABC transporter permease [Paludicola sp. MB14-C6]
MRNYNSMIIKRIITVLLLLTGLTLSVLLQLNLINESASNLPYGVSIQSKEGLKLSFDECAVASSSPNGVAACAIAQKDAELSTEYIEKPVSVELVLTNDNYNKTANLNLLHGEYFTVKMDAKLNKYVVVSDKLAFQIYHRFDATNMPVSINGETYIICGVYQANDSLLSNLSTNGKEQIFVPYRSIENYDKMIIHQVYLRNDNTFFAKGVVGQLWEVLNKYIMYDSISDYRDSIKVIKQSIRIPIFISGIILICVLMYYLVKRMQSFWILIQNKSLSESQTFKRNIFKNSLILFILAISIFTVVKLIQFKLFIPQDFLPPDNIFDIPFYLNSIVQNVQLSNTLMLYDYHKTLSYLMYVTTGINAIVMVILFAVLLYKLLTMRELMKEK